MAAEIPWGEDDNVAVRLHQQPKLARAALDWRQIFPNG
jgi:hypothetical protein